MDGQTHKHRTHCTASDKMRKETSSKKSQFVYVLFVMSGKVDTNTTKRRKNYLRLFYFARLLDSVASHTQPKVKCARRTLIMRERKATTNKCKTQIWNSQNSVKKMFTCMCARAIRTNHPYQVTQRQRYRSPHRYNTDTEKKWNGEQKQCLKVATRFQLHYLRQYVYTVHYLIFSRYFFDLM